MARDNDDNNYYFIKEEIVQKKNKKKALIIRLISLSLAGVFIGIIASITMVLLAPEIYKKVYPNQKNNVIYPDDGVNFNPTLTEKPKENTIDDIEKSDEDKVEPTIVEGNDIKDDEKDPEVDVGCQEEHFTIMDFYEEINQIVNEANKSIVNVNIMIISKDMFGNYAEKTVNTTGIVLSLDNDELYLLVSYDRVKGANTIELDIKDNLKLQAQIFDYELDINMAILKSSLINVEKYVVEDLKPVNLGESYGIQVGQPIIALGCPNGYQRSMARGLISSKGSLGKISDNQFDLFNTDIRDTREGDGVIINYDGEVVGIITRTFKESLNRDINTVIGISRIKPILIKMLNNVNRIYVGIQGSDMADNVLAEYKIGNGIYVDEVDPKSPALLAGVKSGDIIKQIDKNLVKSMSGYNRIISELNVGDEITLLIQRTSNPTEEDIMIKVKVNEKQKN